MLIGAALTAILTARIVAGPAQAARSDVESLDVAVEAPDGQLLTGLTRDDFEVTIDGRSREIESFVAGKDQTLSLVLLVDVTASIDADVGRDVMRKAIEKWFLAKVAPKDRVQVGTIAKEIRIGPPIVNNPRALETAIEKALDPPKRDTFGPSPVWDAIALAVDALKNAPGRRAIILMTDGRATGNRLDVEEAAARAAAAGVLVNVVGEDSEMLLRQEGNTGVRVRPGVALEFLARTTGGLYLPDTASPAAPGPVLERVLADLHERYTMTFALPAADGSPAAFQMSVKRPGVKVRIGRSRVPVS
jgi:VWFA-related protein